MFRFRYFRIGHVIRKLNKNIFNVFHLSALQFLMLLAFGVSLEYYFVKMSSYHWITPWIRAAGSGQLDQGSCCPGDTRYLQLLSLSSDAAEVEVY